MASKLNLRFHMRTGSHVEDDGVWVCALSVRQPVRPSATIPAYGGYKRFPVLLSSR